MLSNKDQGLITKWSRLQENFQLRDYVNLREHYRSESKDDQNLTINFDYFTLLTGNQRLNFAKPPIQKYTGRILQDSYRINSFRYFYYKTAYFPTSDKVNTYISETSSITSPKLMLKATAALQSILLTQQNSARIPLYTRNGNKIDINRIQGTQLVKLYLHTYDLKKNTVAVKSLAALGLSHYLFNQYRELSEHKKVFLKNFKSKDFIEACQLLREHDITKDYPKLKLNDKLLTWMINIAQNRAELDYIFRAIYDSPVKCSEENLILLTNKCNKKKYCDYKDDIRYFLVMKHENRLQFTKTHTDSLIKAVLSAAWNTSENNKLEIQTITEICGEEEIYDFLKSLAQYINQHTKDNNAGTKKLTLALNCYKKCKELFDTSDAEVKKGLQIINGRLAYITARACKSNDGKLELLQKAEQHGYLPAYLLAIKILQRKYNLQPPLIQHQQTETSISTADISSKINTALQIACQETEKTRSYYINSLMQKYFLLQTTQNTPKDTTTTTYQLFEDMPLATMGIIYNALTDSRDKTAVENLIVMQLKKKTPLKPVDFLIAFGISALQKKVSDIYDLFEKIKTNHGKQQDTTDTKTPFDAALDSLCKELGVLKQDVYFFKGIFVWNRKTKLSNQSKNSLLAGALAIRRFSNDNELQEDSKNNIKTLLQKKDNLLNFYFVLALQGNKYAKMLFEVLDEKILQDTSTVPLSNTPPPPSTSTTSPLDTRTLKFYCHLVLKNTDECQEYISTDLFKNNDTETLSKNILAILKLMPREHDARLQACVETLLEQEHFPCKDALSEFIAARIPKPQQPVESELSNKQGNGNTVKPSAPPLLSNQKQPPVKKLKLNNKKGDDSCSINKLRQVGQFVHVKGGIPEETRKTRLRKFSL